VDIDGTRKLMRPIHWRRVDAENSPDRKTGINLKLFDTVATLNTKAYQLRTGNCIPDTNVSMT